ncbi:serine/threonine-protein kinase [Microtetraspora fusca]|uniref:serine/threonine-protein kinase n=1 Tax=Microtetraspora fusca TaxID=1997 RepID=UPI000829B798|nr:serine/threonine-protein kinase [Microtetraspora fusca]
MNRPELREGDVLTRRYLLQERIATGGMSVIWRAFDQSLQRTVAIKVLDGTLDGDHPGRELIRREARATARLIHPDAIEVYDYGETVTNGGRLAAYVVMRLLEGRSLADRVTEGPLPWAEAALIATRLARVLAAAHERGIVHRDVTPENVLLTPDGAKLLDFGIAAFTGEADDHLVADFGTPPYVAPERLRGMTADPAVDVYALGVLLYEMLTGAPPYPETTWEGIEAARRDGPPPMPDVVGLPAEIAELCRRCLSPDPAERPSAHEVAESLAPEPAPDGRRRRGWGAAAAAGAVAVGVLMWSQLGAAGGDIVVARPTTDAPTPAVVSSGASGVTAQAAGEHPRTEPPAEPGDAAEGGGQAPGQRETPRPARNEPTPATQPTGQPARPVADPGGHREPPQGETGDRPSASPAAGPDSRAGDSRPARTRQADSTSGRERDVSALPLATSRRVPLDRAVARFDFLLADGLADAEISPDAALDLKQVLHNSVSGRDVNGVAHVRTKLDDRLREGKLSVALMRRLGGAVDDVHTALARSLA